MNESIKELAESILPYPYSYLPAKAVKFRNNEGTIIKWYDIETGIELPPYFGVGEDAWKLLNDWIRDNNFKWPSKERGVWGGEE